MWQTLMMVSMLLTAVILILLILVQRGKGGGLAGALGGMGGQSAFGTKAGDTFTRVTMVTAVRTRQANCAPESRACADGSV